jgi:hypothetical protein
LKQNGSRVYQMLGDILKMFIFVLFADPVDNEHSNPFSDFSWERGCGCFWHGPDLSSRENVFGAFR